MTELGLRFLLCCVSRPKSLPSWACDVNRDDPDARRGGKCSAGCRIVWSPVEVGPYGIQQPIADGLSCSSKGDIVPAGANKFMFTLAPILAMVPAMIGLPSSPSALRRSTLFENVTVKPFVIQHCQHQHPPSWPSLYAAPTAILGGWASNSKYSLLGGLRSAMGDQLRIERRARAIVGVLIIAGSLSLVKIAEAQAGGVPGTGIFAFPAPQIFAFVVYVISVLETNRVPFDCPKRRQTGRRILPEYSGIALRLLLHRRVRQLMVLVSCIGRRGEPRRVECAPIPAPSSPRSRVGRLRLDRVWPGSRGENSWLLPVLVLLAAGTLPACATIN